MSQCPPVLRALGSWLPVLLIFASILALVPYGRLLSHSLYRLWPESVQQTRPVPVPMDQLAVVDGGLVLHGTDGSVWWMPDGEEARPIALPASCGRLSATKQTDRVACGLDGLDTLAVITVGEGDPRVQQRATPATAGPSLSVGRRLVAGLADGQVLLWDADGERRAISLGGQPVAEVYAMGDTVLAGIGTELVQVGTDGAALRVLHRHDLGEPVHSIGRMLDRVYVATSDSLTAVIVSPTGAETPRYRSSIPLVEAQATRIHPVMSTMAVLSTPHAGARVFRDDGTGRIWWGAQAGPREAAVDCAGGLGQVLCVTEAGVLTLDPYPSKDALIVIVGVLGVLVVLGLLGVVVASGRTHLSRRIAVSLATMAALAWVLSGTLRSPIEALHVLEYGAIGALTFRALCREAGAGWAAAGLAVLIGLGLGLTDESFQAWFPSRTGSFEDVLLDTQAVAIGVVLAWGGLGLGEGRAPLAPAWLPGVGLVLVLACAAFLTVAQGFSHTWHEGHLTWISRWSPDKTRSVDGDPARVAALERSVRMDYGDALRAFSDDPYLYEVRVRLFRRDKRLERGDLSVACGEQALISGLFADTVALTSYRWSPAQRAACEPFLDTDYDSPVGDDRITWTSPLGLWAGAVTLAGLLAALALWMARRAPREAGSM